jgi:DNA topoisomerase-3
MIMTSVSGHLLGLEFVGSYRNWRACNPMALFDAPVSKSCPQDYQQIKVFLFVVYIFISAFLRGFTTQEYYI